ncbi:MAG: hypothetical protein HY644_08885 [Acidobacteria bacterium]|nr:hypothetical protein [Acidobacteriota bacterium]
MFNVALLLLSLFVWSGSGDLRHSPDLQNGQTGAYSAADDCCPVPPPPQE